MMQQIKYAIAGFCMGIAELIPGVSGSTVAVIFKIYKNLMSILSELKWSNLTFNVSQLFQNFQLKLFLPLIGSMMLSIILFSRVIEYLTEYHQEIFYEVLGWLMIILSIQVANFFLSVIKKPLLLVFLFLGIVIGFLLTTKLAIDSEAPHALYLFACGLLAFSFFLIPGISGSAILVALGVYEIVIESISQLNYEILIPFGLGCLVSLLFLPKFILAAYLKYKDQLLFLFAGLIFASGIALILK
jgi:putative membrane protein